MQVNEEMPTEEMLKELLIGKKVTRAKIHDESPDGYTSGPTGILTLSDGMELKVWGHEGGCSCSAGDYPLVILNNCDNIITNVEIEARPTGDNYICRVCGENYCYEHEEDNGWYRIFVYADNQRINLASFEGSDGNGYYGTGWWMSVKKKDTNGQG